MNMLNTAHKVYAKITRRQSIITETLLNEDQFGFKKGCFCTDCTFIDGTTFFALIINKPLIDYIGICCGQ